MTPCIACYRRAGPLKTMNPNSFTGSLERITPYKAQQSILLQAIFTKEIYITTILFYVLCLTNINLNDS